MSSPFTSMFQDLVDARTGQPQILPEPERDPSLPEYEAIENTSLRWLNSAVNDMIVLGWRPIGGISYASNTYCQAMIKPGTKPEPETPTQHIPEDLFEL